MAVDMGITSLSVFCVTAPGRWHSLCLKCIVTASVTRCYRGDPLTYVNVPHTRGAREAVGDAMVLIIEDEAISRRALQSLLRIAGYEVTSVGSAEDGLRMVLNGDVPELAVVDVNLPGMNGVEFMKRARRLSPEMRCIFMSANEEVNLVQIREAFRVPALRKPFDVCKLISLIGHEQPEASMPAH